MKLNLKCGNEMRHGYLNIDKQNLQNIPQDVYKMGDVDNLDWLCKNDEVDEIVANDCVTNVSIGQIKNVIQNWFDKLKSGGRLFIFTPSIEILSKMISHDTITLEEFCSHAFGNKQSAVDAIFLTERLRECGFTTERKWYENVFMFNIEATKP